MFSGCMSAMGNGGSAMGWGMGGAMLLGSVVFLLVVAALVKYLFFQH